ncbi:MAG: polyphosphate polymerase domain-containing protein [Verrucomicrobiota bacterium]
MSALAMNLENSQKSCKNNKVGSENNGFLASAHSEGVSAISRSSSEDPLVIDLAPSDPPDRFELMSGNFYSQKLERLLNGFDPISLSDMDGVSLQNRTDTKFMFGYGQLIRALPELAEHYRILEIEGKRAAAYRSLYFDTGDDLFYNTHQRGRLNRYKVRCREYVASGLCFLEVKFKNNKKRTIKKRIQTKAFEEHFTPESSEFLDEVLPFSPDLLKPILWNEFTRITLVHRVDAERLTIDIGLKFNNERGAESVGSLIVGELKQERFRASSDFIRIIKRQSVRPMRMSKYCVGRALLNKRLRQNKLKVKFKKIQKINDENSV